TAISYVGKTVFKYTVLTPPALPVAVVVSNQAPDGDIVLTQPLVNPSGGVFLATPRQVLDGTTDAPSLVAGSLDVRAGSLGSASNRLDTQLGRLTGDAGSAAYVNNTGALTVGDLVARDWVDVSSTGALTVMGNVSAAGGVGTDTILLHAVDSV